MRIAVFAASLFIVAVAACIAPASMIAVPAPSACRSSARTSGSSGAVTWMAPDDPRDRAKLDAWCATVGPVVVEDAVAPEQKSAVGEVAIVSWNVHVGGGDVSELVERLRRGDFTEGAPVRDFVLLLQEVYRQGPDVPHATSASVAIPATILARPPRGERHAIRELARSLRLHLVYVPAMRNGTRDEDRGNAILSTLPLSDLWAIELPFERQRRVAVAATVRAATGAGAPWQLRVATTHFDTALALMRGGPAAARRRQARALIGTLSPSPMPIVVGGDFNTWWGDDEPAIRELRRAFPDARPPGSTPTWGGVFRTLGAIDHVFARVAGERLQVLRLPEKFGSDHYPLLTIVPTASLDTADRLSGPVLERSIVD